MHGSMRSMRNTIIVLCVTGTLATAVGCASHTKTTTKVVTTREPETAGDSPIEDGRTSASKTVSTTTTESDDRSPGIVGSTFRLVWAVISFPFRVIGALF